jgi:hypothetical protein
MVLLLDYLTCSGFRDDRPRKRNPPRRSSGHAPCPSLPSGQGAQPPSGSLDEPQSSVRGPPWERPPSGFFKGPVFSPIAIAFCPLLWVYGAPLPTCHSQPVVHHPMRPRRKSPTDDPLTDDTTPGLDAVGEAASAVTVGIPRQTASAATPRARRQTFSLLPALIPASYPVGTDQTPAWRLAPDGGNGCRCPVPLVWQQSRDFRMGI